MYGSKVRGGNQEVPPGPPTAAPQGALAQPIFTDIIIGGTLRANMGHLFGAYGFPHR